MPETEPQELQLSAVGGRVRLGSLGRLGWLQVVPDHGPACAFTDHLAWLAAGVQQLGERPLRLRSVGGDRLQAEWSSFFQMALVTVDVGADRFTVGLDAGALAALQHAAGRLVAGCVPQRV